MKKILTTLLILFSLPVLAQQKPTLYLIGDSTMADKKDPEVNPEHGWGQMLPELMTSEIKIENHAVNGRSTRSFIAEGRWEEVRKKLKPGDFVFIQFGHNDQKIKDPSRYTNPYTQYRYNLEKFVKETQEKRATPILFSSIVRRKFNEYGVLVDTHGPYPLVTRMVAEDLDVPFVDLQWLTEKLEINYGPEASKELHLHLETGDDPYEPKGRQDDTHLSEKGATLVASMALQEVARQKVDLKEFIKRETLNREILDSGHVSWREILQQEKEWYASEEAQRIAENVLLYQKNNGGWHKNIDMATHLSGTKKQELEDHKSDELGTTIDNGATYTQLRYLAKVYNATGREKYKRAFLEGVDYLLMAQYDNGGWPQFYPIKDGYYEHITYNDGAMIGVMNLLKDIAKNDPAYSFVDAKRRKKSQKAIDKGLEVILATQVKVDGELTIWCAQHDKDDFSPAKARAYELPSLSGKESAEIVEYLLQLDDPSEAVKRSIRSAVQWFEDHKVMGEKVVWKKDPEYPEGRDRVVVQDSNAGPLWGRFNDIQTGKPFFVGRDGTKHKHLADIEQERRVGYSYIDNYAEELLEKDYPAWEKKH